MNQMKQHFNIDENMFDGRQEGKSKGGGRYLHKPT